MQRAPGLCQVVAPPPPPLVGLHTKRLRGSRRRRRPPAPERRWGWRCRGAAAAGGDAGRACAGRGDTAALRRAEEAQPRPRLLREPARGGTPARPPRPPAPDALSPRRAPGCPCPAEPERRAHPEPVTRAAREPARAPRTSLPPLLPPAELPPPSNPTRPRAWWTAPPSVWRQDLPARAPPGGLQPSGRAEEEPRWREADPGRRRLVMLLFPAESGTLEGLSGGDVTGLVEKWLIPRRNCWFPLQTEL